MKSSLLLLLFLLIRQTIFAQFAGQVSDADNQPIAYANVCLLSGDSILISGTVTDENGRFRIEKTADPCFLRISCIGYQNFYERLDPDKHRYVLNALDMRLDEVTVSAHRKNVKIQGTNLIADVEHSVLRDFGTADDILDKIPLVYGKDGQYSVFGKGAAVVYINRRKVTDMSELTRLNSKDIASVEVIRNPGIQYDADMNAVIKINLKRNFIEGWSVGATLGDKQGRRNSDNEQLQLTYGGQKINAFATFSNSSLRLSTDQRNEERVDTEVGQWVLKSDMDRWPSNYYNQDMTGGLSLFLHENHTVGGQVSYSEETDRWGGSSVSSVMRNEVDFESLRVDINARSRYRQWNSNLYYEGKLSSKLTLNVNGDMLRRKANGGRVNAESGDLTDSHVVNSRDENEYAIYSGLLTMDYAPNSSTSFTWGSNVSFVENKLRNQSADETVEYNLSALRSKETKYAFFAEGGYSYKRFSARLGLRYEGFKMIYTDDLTHAVLEDRAYNRFYPYLSCSYSDKKIKMGISLSTKVRRPTYYQLRNSTDYLNRYSMEQGNPLLLPQYTTSLSYTAQYRTLTFFMDYQWIKDYIMSGNIVSRADPLLFLSKPVNLSHYTALNAGFSYNMAIGVWEPEVSANLTRTYLPIYDENHRRINGNRPYIRASLNNYWRLGKQWMPYLLIGYNNDGYMREYRIKQNAMISLGISKRLFDNQLYVRLSVENLLGAKEDEIRYDTGYVFSKSKYKDNRRVGIYIRYNFNAKKKYKGKSSASEEMNRL